MAQSFGMAATQGPEFHSGHRAVAWRRVSAWPQLKVPNSIRDTVPLHGAEFRHGRNSRSRIPFGTPCRCMAQSFGMAATQGPEFHSGHRAVAWRRVSAWPQLKVPNSIRDTVPLHGAEFRHGRNSRSRIPFGTPCRCMAQSFGMAATQGPEFHSGHRAVAWRRVSAWPQLKVPNSIRDTVPLHGAEFRHGRNSRSRIPFGTPSHHGGVEVPPFRPHASVFAIG